MEARTAIAAVLRAVNDHTAVRPYGDGLLVDLPLNYGDGDAVRVLVEPMGDGYRVSDRAAAHMLLSMAGVNPNEGKAADAIAEVRRSTQLNGVDAAPGELATFGTTDDLGTLILDVAQASLRVDQLRWLAVTRPSARFVEVHRGAEIPLKSGRKRPVTLTVASGNKVAYLQALSRRDPDQATEHCYYLFSLAEEVPAPFKIAALDGRAGEWPSQLVEELKLVGSVEYFDDPTSLEHRLDRIVPPPAAALV
jgi:hypothetical protein